MPIEYDPYIMVMLAGAAVANLRQRNLLKLLTPQRAL